MSAWFWISLAIPALAGVGTVTLLVRAGKLRDGWELLAVVIAFLLALLIVLFVWAEQIAG